MSFFKEFYKTTLDIYNDANKEQSIVKKRLEEPKFGNMKFF